MSIELNLSESTAAAIADIEHGADLFLEALAEAVRDQFRDNVHVVTGAMQASASVVTEFGSDYGENVARAAALNPAANFAPEATAGPQEAFLQVPVGYAIFEELGTTRRPAHPALVPAVESVAAGAEAIARKVFGL